MMKKCHNSSIKNRNKEIGSYFSISPQDIEDSYRQSENRILDSEILLYSTCRSAIKCILENLGDNSKKALLPAFTCHAVVEPFCACHYQIFPYQINKDLSIDLQSLDEIVCSVNPAVILIHDYFGFDSNDALKNSELFEKYRNRGIVIIEDLTQSMFSKYKHIKADYFVGSIRKWVGIPDGAFLKGTGITSITRQDIELVEAKKKAMIYKHNYLTKNEGTKEELMTLYRTAEKILDSREITYGMSDISKKLFFLYDIDEFCSIRKRNAIVLMELLSNIKNIELPFEKVKKNETPFYIPVMVKHNRRELQQFLAQNGVYATIIWQCPDEFVNKLNMESKWIYDTILCVPCDQRYTVDDMVFIGELFDRFEKTEGIMK